MGSPLSNGHKVHILIKSHFGLGRVSGVGSRTQASRCSGFRAEVLQFGVLD